MSFEKLLPCFLRPKVSFFEGRCWILMVGLLSLVAFPRESAAQHSSKIRPPLGSRESKRQRFLKPDQASSPSNLATPFSASSPSEGVREPLDKKTIVNRVLALWNLSRGQEVPGSQLYAAGLSPSRVEQFKASLKPNQKLSDRDRRNMRIAYQPKNLPAKMQARERFNNFIRAFQTSFPDESFQLPEILTAWGESRDLSGANFEADRIQKAKMAGVIHVIQNRARRRQRFKSYEGLPLEKLKWEVVTRRYQFSAFEPYDPNLAQLAMGPGGLEKISGLEDLPALDRRALGNLAEVLIELRRGQIDLLPPLASREVRHYLTPRLQPFSNKSWRALLSRQKKKSRVKPLKIPGENPKFISILPFWVEQNALIAEPGVEFETAPSGRVEIPVDDFVFFQGIL